MTWCWVHKRISIPFFPPNLVARPIYFPKDIMIIMCWSINDCQGSPIILSQMNSLKSISSHRPVPTRRIWWQRRSGTKFCWQRAWSQTKRPMESSLKLPPGRVYQDPLGIHRDPKVATIKNAKVIEHMDLENGPSIYLCRVIIQL